MRAWKRSTSARAWSTSTDLATAVYVQGESDQSWVTDSGAIAAYGRQERAVNDGDLKTTTQRTRAGDRALAEQASPVVDGSLVCWEPGLRGGMKAGLVNDLWGLDVTIVLVSVDITAVEARKKDACFLHTWYKDRPDLDLWTNVDVMHRSRGREAGCKYAEAFIRHSKNRGDLPVPAARS